MTTPPGWQPRPGYSRGEAARRAPRGAGGWSPDDGGPGLSVRDAQPAAWRGADGGHQLRGSLPPDGGYGTGERPAGRPGSGRQGAGDRGEPTVGRPGVARPGPGGLDQPTVGRPGVSPPATGRRGSGSQPQSPRGSGRAVPGFTPSQPRGPRDSTPGQPRDPRNGTPAQPRGPRNGTPAQPSGPRDGAPGQPRDPRESAADGAPPRVPQGGPASRPRPGGARPSGVRSSGGGPAARSSGSGPAARSSGDGPAVRRPSGSQLASPPPAPLLRLIGRLRIRAALLLIAAGTVIGVILTLLAGQEPGVLLGFFIIIGSLAAILSIRRPAIYLLFPLPALFFFAGAIVTGIVHDSELAGTTAGLGAGFAHWISGIFYPMVVATILVVLVGGCRWLFGSTLVTAHVPAPADQRPGPGSPRPGAAGRRPLESGSWSDEAFTGMSATGTGRPGSSPRRGPGGRPGRASGSQPDRDPWGDPRLPADRSQSGRGPGQPDRGQPGPADQGQDTGPRRPRPGASQPGERTSPPRERTARPQPGPSWNPVSRPQRPPRQPPEGWNPR